MNIRALALSSAALIAVQPVVAQDTAPVAPQPIEESQPGDIVVTAQKRSERLQDVPVAVSVVSGETLAKLGAVNLENAQYLVPTLNFRKSGISINQSLFLRGVGTSTFSIAGEPSVSTVVDGVVYSRAGEAFSDLVDIERIEVLRGPQGTLFGKNASAGVVNIVTTKPTDTFGGYAEASFFTKSEYRGRVVLNAPLAEGIRTRITGFYGEYDGNIRNLAANVDDRVNGYKHYGVRGVLVADLTPDIQLTLIGDYRKADDDCCAEVIAAPPINAATGAVNTANLNLIQPGLPPIRGDDSRAIRQNLVTKSIEESYGFSGQLDVGLGDHTITSITAYRSFDSREIRDGDFLDQAYVTFNQLHDDGPQTATTFSQELRLTSPTGGLIEYVLGGFYSRAESERTFTRNDIVCTATPAPTVLTPCGAAGTTPSTFPSGTANFGSTFKNLAFFGQGTINVSDRFRVIAGLRYTDDKLSVFHIRRTTLAGPGINGNFDAGVYNNGALNPVNPPGGFLAGPSNGIPFRARTSDDNLSGKAGVQFDFVPESTGYATYSRGYKGPAFNTFFNLTTVGVEPLESETSDAYELGLKNTLAGGAVVINIAAYYAKYKNYQANNPDFVAGVRTTRFTNAGTISTRGAEVDFLIRPSAQFNIAGGIAYTDAKVDQFRLPPGANPADLIPNGTRLGYAPEWKMSLGGDYTIEFGGPVNLVLGAQSSYQSEQLSLFVANPFVRDQATIRSYGIVDVQAALVDVDERFRVSFQVKNLFDQSFAAAITDGGPAGTFRYIIPREADRYFGVTARVNFGS